MAQRSLLDLNVLIALADQRHEHHRRAQRWFASKGTSPWGICPITEAGFLRVTTNPAFHPTPHGLSLAIAILQSMRKLPGYQYWEVKESWVDLTASFVGRVAGHQQITDAYLLGLAIRHNALLVTFDRGIRYLAGPEFAHHVLLLE